MEALYCQARMTPFTTYIYGSEDVSSFFDYHPTEETQLKKRYEEIMSRSYKRLPLVKALKKYNVSLGASEATLKNIERLKEEEAVVVISGQQAGLFTGPLYTIHKILSTLHYAKEAEKKLQKPVVPVFWVAGEDHDWDEVNHVYVPKKHDLARVAVKKNTQKRMSVSHTPILPEHHRIVASYFRNMHETRHSKEVYELLTNELKQSENWTEYFSRLILKLFKEEGIVLLDAANPNIRCLERNFFAKFIHTHERITEALNKQQSYIRKEGFQPILDIAEESVHLFYIFEQERKTIFWSSERNSFYTKDNLHQWTKEQLLLEVESYPERFSNNVVTRPMMQDFLFPTLQFVAGPGEFMYWSELKSAFHTCSISMPIVALRHSYTYISNRMSTWMETYGISEQGVLSGEIEEAMKRYARQDEIEHYSETWSTFIDQQLHSFMQASNELLLPLEGVAGFAKNREQQMRDVLQQYKKEYVQQYRHRVLRDLKRLERMQNELHSNNGPQERTLNVFYFINEYGFEWFKNVKELKLSCPDTHIFVRM